MSENVSFLQTLVRVLGLLTISTFIFYGQIALYNRLILLSIHDDTPVIKRQTIMSSSKGFQTY